MATDTTLARAFVKAEDAAIERLHKRADRVASTLRANGTDEREAIIRGMEIAARPAKDGAHATGRLDAKVRPTSATSYEGDTRVTGALCKLRASVSPSLTRKQSKVRASVASANAAADACKRYATLDASHAPGGNLWRRCKNRAAKRALAKARHEASKLARSGDYRGACLMLTGRV